ncbi:MAG TPA: glycosyltransferase [Nitrososphaera sp.]|jgi:hyaluronan synthase
MQRQERNVYPHRELDKKRWLVRYLCLAALGVILSIKVYLLLFILDFTVGVYSFITTFVLFSTLLLSYMKFRDPYFLALEKTGDKNNNSSPLVSVILPVKNEEGHIADCVKSCINSTYPNKEIIVVNDGSTDGTAKVLDDVYRASANPNLHIIHLSKNVGKKKAIEAGASIANGEIYVFIDSDCEMAPDSVEKFVRIFNSDHTIGAITAHGRVRNVSEGNILEKIEDVWYDGQFRIIKGMESSFSSVTCCSGALSAYRRIAVQPHISSWAHEKFLGKEFKFATDRRLTAYVLAGKPPAIRQEPKTIADHNPTILQTGNDELEVMKLSLDPDDDDSIVRESSGNWKVLYSPSIHVSIGPPSTFTSFIRQQIRWRKSFIRSIFATGKIYWKRPLMAALLYYLQMGLKFFRPFIVLKSIVLLPLAGDYYTGALFISAVLFTGMIYGIDFRLRNPGSSLWLYRPLMTLLSTFVLTWLLIYSAITIRKMSWR